MEFEFPALNQFSSRIFNSPLQFGEPDKVLLATRDADEGELERGILGLPLLDLRFEFGAKTED